MSNNIPITELTPVLDLDSQIAEAGFAKCEQIDAASGQDESRQYHLWTLIYFPPYGHISPGKA